MGFDIEFIDYCGTQLDSTYLSFNWCDMYKYFDPTYTYGHKSKNVEKYLERAIKSLEEQGYKRKNPGYEYDDMNMYGYYNFDDDYSYDKNNQNNVEYITAKHNCFLALLYKFLDYAKKYPNAIWLNDNSEEILKIPNEENPESEEELKENEKAIKIFNLK